jgi:1-aminocyclopropane-1-carboxylate deaminase/D-cysteine desulfhydrase-like pyridoxal-dependent ACC family enzyme
MNLDRLPRVSLARLPTPLEEAPRFAAALGVARLLVKRDDLTDLALGGNKVRKLEFLLGDARAQGAGTIITTAALQSNFLRLAAAAARRVGMTPVFVVRGRADAPSQGNLLLMRLFDAEIHYVATEDPYAESTIVLMREIGEQVLRQGGHPYLVHLATFSGGLAAVGYVPAAFELAEQLETLRARCDHMVLADGSGTTHAGLLLGLRLAGLRAHVLGASVNTAAAALRGHVQAQIRAAAEILGVTPPVRDDEIDITDAHVGPGYGIPTEDSVNAVRFAARSEGLLFDPTYTGKAWAALSAAVRSGAIGREATVVFMHTGGAPILFTQAAALAPPVPAPA